MACDRRIAEQPFAFTIERELTEATPEPTDRPGERLVRVFASLEAGEFPGDDVPQMQVRRAAAIAALSEADRRITLHASRGKAVTLDHHWAERLKHWLHQRQSEQALPPQFYSVAGRLEGVDVHGRKSKFYVYDPLTDQKMRCIFCRPRA